MSCRSWSLTLTLTLALTLALALTLTLALTLATQMVVPVEAPGRFPKYAPGPVAKKSLDSSLRELEEGEASASDLPLVRAEGFLRKISSGSLTTNYPRPNTPKVLS